MFTFLHAFHPSPILLSLGPVHIYWYGFFIMLGTLAALTVAVYLAKFYQIKTDTIINLAFWLIIGGIIGARFYDVFIEWPYFSAHPGDILKIWQGGLAIHGAIIGGAIALWWFAKKHSHNFWQLAAIVITALPLAQAIGRWGNYFNQELFGYPTGLPWGIPIDPASRPWQYINYDYFHPAFLYESFGDLFIFIILILLQIWLIKNQKFMNKCYVLCVMCYVFLYSLFRFSLEFIRVDPAPIVLGLRFPQLVSLAVIIICLIYPVMKFGRMFSQKSALDK
jgi:phosphatidylglycerol:prolipoprotein diacylglycerol transferase